MGSEISLQQDWVAASVGALRKTSSWTGRIHVHKLLFLAEALNVAKPPFEFQLYQYGPYSFELDSVIAGMDADGLVSKEYPSPGYGPRYNVERPVMTKASERMDPKDLKAIGRLAGLLRNFSSNDLELIATCIWAKRREGVTGDQEIIQRVRQIKPKYSEAQIKASLGASKKVESSLN